MSWLAIDKHPSKHLNANANRTSCEVCGSADVLRDAVERLELAECGRCQHRWTWHSAPPVALRVAARVPASLPLLPLLPLEDVASAA